METQQTLGLLLNTSSKSFVNNENALLKAPGSTYSQHKSLTIKAGKTPAHLKTRRAFGDISNRKLDVSFAHDAKNRTPSAKSEPSARKTNGKEVKQVSVLKLDKKPHQRVVSELQKTTLSTRKVEFILPQKQKNVETENDWIVKESLHKASDAKTRKEQFFDEIRSAGRTWAQQKANGDHDEQVNDDVSLDGANTLREDFLKILAEDREHKRKMQQAEDEATDKYLDDLFSQWVKHGIGEENFDLQIFVDKDLHSLVDDDFSIDLPSTNDSFDFGSIIPEL